MNQTQEYDFSFKIPFYKHSIKPINMKNSEGLIIGNLQRTYNNLSDRVIDPFLSLANKKNFKVKLNDNPEYSFSASFVKYKKAFLEINGPFIFLKKETYKI